MDFEAALKDFVHSQTGKVLMELCNPKFVVHFVTIFIIINCVLILSCILKIQLSATMEQSYDSMQGGQAETFALGRHIGM